MSKKRWLDTKFWSDSYIEKLDPIEKLLFIYLMTNERSNVAGVYELPLKFMAVETGIEKSMLETILERFEKDKKIVRYDGWLRLVNAMKHQNVNNHNIKAGVKNVLDNVPTDVTERLFKTLEDPSRPSRYLDLDLNLNLDLNSNLENVAKAPSALATVDENATRLATLLLTLTSSNFAFLKQRTAKEKERDVANWAIDIDKLHRLDGYDWSIVEAVINWSQEDEFWKKNIRSGVKLRKQFDKLLIDAKQEHDNKTSRVVIAGQDNGTDSL